jgi:hypothetical protein
MDAPPPLEKPVKEGVIVVLDGYSPLYKESSSQMKAKSVFISFSHPVNKIDVKTGFCRYNNDCIVFISGSILSNIT